MTWLTPSEATKLMAYRIKDSGLMNSYPYGLKQKKEYEMHNKKEDNKKRKDPKYITKPWYRKGYEPIKRTQEEITERNYAFIKQMISERPADFDYMKEVDSFDPIENFKKECEAIVMTEEQIAKVKEAAATVGMVLVLKDGTKLYCESIEQGKKVIKTRSFADADYVEYGEEIDQ